MADLTDIQASQSVKIAGANPSTGIEDNFMEVDSFGRITSKQAQNLVSGSLTGSQNLDIDTAGMSVLILRISGSYTGSLNFLISLDGGSTYPDIVNGYNEYDGLEYSSATTSPVLFKINISGYTNFRLSAAAITGTADIQMCATQGTDIKTNAFLFSGTGSPLTANGSALDVNVNNAISATISGTVAVSAVSLPLPSGAATSANQSTMITDLGGVTETAPATDTASSGLNGRLQRIAQRLTSLIALLPASLGQKAMSASLAVTVASDQSAIPASQSGTWTVQPGNTANTTAWKVDGSAVTQPVSNAGTFATQAAQSGTWNINNISGTVSLPTGAATESTQSAQSTLMGAVTETAPASDTASSGLNGRLQRIAQRLTSLIGLLPSSLGQKASASSLAIVLSTEQEAELGIVTETAPASDTASSGLNGRLQRIAQRITSLIALLPTSLGQKTMSASLAVTIASDQTSIPYSNASGSQAAITVGTSALIANVSGTTNLTSRKILTAYNNGTVVIYWGYTNAVTTSTGTPMNPGNLMVWEVGPSTSVYLISGTASQNVRITENA